MSRHRFHGDPERFHVVAEFVYKHYGPTVRFIADVAGGQGMLSRILRKKYNYDCEVVDARGWTLRGVSNRTENFDVSMAEYYDLIIGLHPDEATPPIAQAACITPAVLIPCCNFWASEKLGQIELLEAIEHFYFQNQVRFERFRFPFKGPKNIGIVSEPPKRDISDRTTRFP